MKRKDQERLLDMLVARQKMLNSMVEDNARLKDALAQMKDNLDDAQNELRRGREIRDDYVSMTDRLHAARAELSITRTDMKILREALADKKAGNPNWEKVAELKMRKARY